MKILLLEDDANKRAQIRALLDEVAPDAAVRECRSYQSAVEGALEFRPHLLILDMTVPTYDQGPAETGWRTRVFGGRDVLGELDRYGIHSASVVVTQFESFGEGRQRKDLLTLTEELVREFGEVFLGAIYYHPAESTWRRELRQIVERIQRGEETDER